MNLTEDLSHDQYQEVEPIGGASQTAFPAVERWIMDSADNRNALEHVLRTDDLLGFRSLLDSVTCLVFPELRSVCMAFYRNSARPLKDFMSKDQQVVAEKMILQILAYSVVVYESYYQRIALPYTWAEFIRNIRNEVPLTLQGGVQVPQRSPRATEL